MLDPLHTVRRLEGGLFMERLAADLADVADAVLEWGPGAKGKVAVTISISRQKEEAVPGALRFSVDFTPVKPKRKPVGQVFFVNQGELFDRPPESEPETPVRVVDSPAAVVREQPEGAVAERKAE